MDNLSIRNEAKDERAIKKIILIMAGLLLAAMLIGNAEAASGSFSTSGSGLYSSYSYQPSFQSYYSDSAGDKLGTRISAYWPILNPDECKAQQDLLLQVAPGGCQPAIVRSDLLAEQNVPVFCQIDALKLNPLVDIKEINNINFQGEYPKGVLGAGFHPAKAALRTHDILLGSPLLNNIGYAVVVLKKNEKESEQPESVVVNLSGTIRYNSENALGIGRSEFYLNEMSDQEWESEKIKQSFWKGRYYIRLENADANNAIVSIYSGDRKVATINSERGKLSRPFYVPGSYCRAGIKVEYEGLESADKKAKIEISDETGGSDAIEIYEGSKFLDGRCEVQKDGIFLNAIDSTGLVKIKCKNTQEFTLSLNPNLIITGSDAIILPEGTEIYKGFLKIEGIKGVIQKIGSENEVCEANLNKLNKQGIIPGFYYVKKNKNNAEGWEIWIRADNKSAGKMIEDSLKSNQALRSLKDEMKARCESKALLVEKKYDAETDRYFNLTIAGYEKVADEYGSERPIDVKGTESYGEKALQAAIETAEKFSKYETKVRLMQKYIENYPGTQVSEEYKNNIEQLFQINYADSGKSALIDNRYKSFRLISLGAPNVEKTSATFLLDGRSRITLGSETEYRFTTKDGREASFKLSKVKEPDRVTIISDCPDDERRQGSRPLSQYFAERFEAFGKTIKLNEPNSVCGTSILLESVKIGQYAKVRLIPEADRTETKTNLTVRIGIEKRAISLSPNRTQGRIDELNASIQKWEGISKSLGNVVKGMKGACFATAGVLTVKNFLDGIDGTSLAREHTMQGEDGWKKKCSDLIAGKKYKTPTECFNDNALEINKEVKIREEALQKVNAKLKEIESQKDVSSGSAASAGGKSVDTQKAMASYVSYLKEKYPNDEFIQKKLDAPSNDFTPYTYSDLREIDYSLELEKKGLESKAPETKYSEIKSKIEKNDEIRKNYQTAKEASEKLGGQPGLIGTSARGIPAQGTIYEISKADGKLKIGNQEMKSNPGMVGGATHAMHVSGAPNPVKGIPQPPGEYLVIGEKKGDLLYPSAVYKYNPATQEIQLSNDYTSDVKKFQRDFGVSTFNDIGKKVYAFPIRQADLKVRYFETGPEKGYAGQVPIDIVNGWYVRVRSNYRVGNQASVYDSSGIPRSWDICNVGVNGRVDENDDCQLVVDGQSSDVQILGLSPAESRKLIEKSRQALMDANRNKGNKFVQVLGERYETGAGMSLYSGVECQDFMSPEDCKILFNACDPVICPASRCNLGGQYYVSDVVQSGIIGSTLLCLPNIREGVYIPVCLTGIQAGIDSYLSILKSSRDCLQENLKSGKIVGICDQITSVYMCEFFWRQVAPVAKVILPKIIESAYGQGQGARGGGEYLTVSHAWNNMENSIAYFKESYAVNSLNAFKARSLEEAGGEFCKAFVSAKAPKVIDTLLEPDSPPQFYASFSSVKYSDVTVPATAQYKVFYHIFGGKDSGIYFRVYLKNPPQSTSFAAIPVLQVDSGFIPRGEYRSQSRDFTAPEGYKELCVDINGKEECGFNSVSSSFAVDYLKDKLTADELVKPIKSEKECVSSSPSLAGAVSNLPNPGAALEQGIAGENYKRGIVRICASQNPGGRINPRRYSDVGYCGDEKTRCWLDGESVKRAISDGNAGVKNATLKELEALQRATLEKQGIVLPEGDAIARLNELEADKNRLEGFESATELLDGHAEVPGANAIIKKADGLVDMMFYNHHKARLALIKAQVYQKVAEAYFRSYRPTAVSQKDEEKAGSSSQDTTAEEKKEIKCATPIINIYKGKTKINGIEEVIDIYFRYNEREGWEWSVDKEEWVSVQQNKVETGYYAVYGESLWEDETKQILLRLAGVDFGYGNSLLLDGGARCEVESASSISSSQGSGATPIELKDAKNYDSLKNKIPSILNRYFREDVNKELKFSSIIFVDVENPRTDFEKQQAEDWNQIYGSPASAMADSNCQAKGSPMIIRIDYSNFANRKNDREFVDTIIHEALHCISRYHFNDIGYSKLGADHSQFNLIYNNGKSGSPFDAEYNKIENILNISLYSNKPDERKDGERFSFLGADIAIAEDYPASPAYSDITKYPQEILALYNKVLKLDNLIKKDSETPSKPGKADFLLIGDEALDNFYFYEIKNSKSLGIYVNKKGGTIKRSDSLVFDWVNPDDEIGSLKGTVTEGIIKVNTNQERSTSGKFNVITEYAILDGASVKDHKVYSKGKTALSTDYQKLKYSWIAKEGTFYISGTKIYLGEAGLLYYNKIALDPDIGRLSENLESGFLRLDEVKASRELGKALYDELKDAEVRNAEIFLKTDAKAFEVDFKVLAADADGRTYLYDLLSGRDTNIYLEGNQLFYLERSSRRGALEGVLSTEPKNIGRVVSGRVVIYGEFYDLIGKDYYDRLRNAYVNGDKICSRERKESDKCPSAGASGSW